MNALAILDLPRGDPILLGGPALRSPLPGVPDRAWATFVFVLETQPLSAISDSNGLGCFEMRPRRLGDLGMMTSLRAVRRRSRQVFEGTFVLPLTLERFLRDPLLQYGALRRSLERHDGEDVAKKALPEGVTRAGALALRHRGGPGALSGWAGGSPRFPRTEELFLKANGIF